MKLIIQQERNSIVAEVRRVVLKIIPFHMGSRQMLEANEATKIEAGGNDFALTDSDPVIVFVDPQDANIVITLPPEGSANHGYVIVHSGNGGEVITVKNDGGDTIRAIYEGELAWFLSNTLEWRSAGGGGLYLSDLTDIDLTGLADDHILRYDLASGKWKPEAPPSAPNTIIVQAEGVISSVANISMTIATGQPYNYYISTNAANANDGDEYSFYANIDPGNYKFIFNLRKTSSSGIIDIYLDGTLVFSGIDTYAGSAAFYQYVAGTNLAVPTPGDHIIKVKVNSKNGSSSDYVVQMTNIVLIKQ